MARTRRQAVLAVLGVAFLAIAVLVPATAEAAGGSATFSATGADQSFTVPAGVTGLVADVFGARGGAGVAVTGTGTLTQPGASGGEASATLSVTPNQVIEVAVGGHGVDASGTPFATAGAGGFNGGGDGSIDPSSGCCPGGGGGGATDVRTGACATTLTCDVTTRVLVAAGGGGAGGGTDAVEPGGDGGGATGGNGTNSPGGATGGTGATATTAGAGGTGSAAGSPGDQIAATGGQGGGGGGGGGGGLHGGGGGAADNTPDGAGGGGGSGLLPVTGPGHMASGVNNADGSATFYWMTASPAAPIVGQTVTLTSQLPVAAAGGTETFTNGATVLCASVTVAADGSATCSAVLPMGSNSVTATYTGTAQLLGLTETTLVPVAAAPTAAPTATPAATSVPVPVTGASGATPRGPSRGWVWVAVGVLLLALAAVPGRFRGDHPSRGS